MDRPDKSALRRAHDAAVGYHLLVALLFTGCLPLDTARAAAAQAFSLPG